MKGSSTKKLTQLDNILDRDSDEDLHLGVVDIPNKGKGVIATTDIDKDDYVIEYAATLLSFRGAKMKVEEYNRDGKGSYVYEFRHESKWYYLDATEDNGWKKNKKKLVVRLIMRWI
jgi:hypothetical protein